MMRITVTAKGELEEYIKQQMEKTGLSAGMICCNLAFAGMEYKEGLRSFSVLAKAVQDMEKQKEKEAKKNDKKQV